MGLLLKSLKEVHSKGLATLVASCITGCTTATSAAALAAVVGSIPAVVVGYAVTFVGTHLLEASEDKRKSAKFTKHCADVIALLNTVHADVDTAGAKLDELYERRRWVWARLSGADQAHFARRVATAVEKFLKQYDLANAERLDGLRIYLDTVLDQLDDIHAEMQEIRKAIEASDQPRDHLTLAEVARSGSQLVCSATSLLQPQEAGSTLDFQFVTSDADLLALEGLYSQALTAISNIKIGKRIDNHRVWLRLSPRSFVLLRERPNASPCGFGIVLRIAPMIAKAYWEGQKQWVWDWNTPLEILPHDAPGQPCLYAQTWYLAPTVPVYPVAFARACIRHLAMFCTADQTPIIFGPRKTLEGVDNSKALGLTQRGYSADGFPLFVLDGENPENDDAKAAIELLRNDARTLGPV